MAPEGSPYFKTPSGHLPPGSSDVAHYSELALAPFQT